MASTFAASTSFYLVREMFNGQVLIRESVPPIADFLSAVSVAEECDTDFQVLFVDLALGVSRDVTKDILNTIAAKSFDSFTPLHYVIAEACDSFNIEHYRAPLTMMKAARNRADHHRDMRAA